MIGKKQFIRNYRVTDMNILHRVLDDSSDPQAAVYFIIPLVMFAIKTRIPKRYTCIIRSKRKNETGR